LRAKPFVILSEVGIREAKGNAAKDRGVLDLGADELGSSHRAFGSTTGTPFWVHLGARS
jgi:hypothetical protein